MIEEMKESIRSVIALMSVVITCTLVTAGCTPDPGYIILDPGSTLRHPTFCYYQDASFQNRLGISSITVWKVPHASEKKKRWEIDWPFDDRQKVWSLEYKASDIFMKRQWILPVSCLTYGEVPPGYQEKVKVEPLAPEEFYGVRIRGESGTSSENLYFIIRLDEKGSPERLEYHQGIFLITPPGHATQPRDALKLD